MRTIDQYFDEFTSVNGSNIGYPVMYDYPENEPDPILDSFIQFEDPEAEKAMVNAFGKNGKITYRQAKNVTDAKWKKAFFVSYKTKPLIVEQLKNISKFNEFKYFTGLTTPFLAYKDGYASFVNNTTLQEITIPSTVKSLGSFSFYNCTNLRKINGGSGINMLYKSVFYNAKNLESLGDIDFKNTVDTIGFYAFHNSSAYKALIDDNGIVDLTNLKAIGDTPFSLLGTEDPKYSQLIIKIGKKLNKIIIANGFSTPFTIINADICSNWFDIDPENKLLKLQQFEDYQVVTMSLKEVISNPDITLSKSYIPSQNTDNLLAFFDLGIKRNAPSVIKIPEGIEVMLPGSARQSLQNTLGDLVTVVFPESLKYIGDRCMQYGDKIETLVFKSTEPPLCNEVFMSYNKNLTKVYVPKASIDKYKNNFKYILGNKTNQQLLAIEDMPEDLKAKLL